MEITKESLVEAYQEKETEELISLKANSDLTEIAIDALNIVLSQRGVTSEKEAAITKEIDKPHVIEIRELGFKWWNIWAFLGLIFGNSIILRGYNSDATLTLSFVAINTILMFLILKYNKYAFLIATVLSLNPILWIINGIYLENRWRHPKVNRKNR